MKKMLAAAVAAVMTMSASMAMADGAIKIGEIGPLTGAAAIYGTAVANGAQIAIDELSARGGQQYVLNAQDDEADAEKSVNAYSLGFLGKLDSIAGVVASRACNYWDPACCLFNSKSDAFEVLLISHCGSLAGRSANNNSVSTVCDLVLNKVAETLIIDRTVCVHRCDDGNACTRKNSIFHTVVLPS